MPGTDVGSAPQESWHTHTLKSAFPAKKYEPFELARILQERIVDPQLKFLQDMASSRSPFQDWPGVGQFIDQHILRNEAALSQEGRTMPQKLLDLSLHQVSEDEQGNGWMLVPKSRLKVDWAKSGKRKVYKERRFRQLPPHSVQQFDNMVQATASIQIRQAWGCLGLYQHDGEVD